MIFLEFCSACNLKYICFQNMFVIMSNMINGILYNTLTQLNIQMNTRNQWFFFSKKDKKKIFFEPEFYILKYIKYFKYLNKLKWSSKVVAVAQLAETELHRILNLTKYRMPNVFIHEEFLNTEYRIVFLHEIFSNIKYQKYSFRNNFRILNTK